MKCRYRIIKEKKQINNVTDNESFFIQKKFLFWWIDIELPCGFCLSNQSGTLSKLMIDHRICCFKSISQARHYLQVYCINPFRETYNDSEIVMVIDKILQPDPDRLSDYYVNKSDVKEYYDKKPCYDFDYNLEHLKSRIVRKKTVREVVTENF